MASPKVYFFFISGAKKGKIESATADQVIRIGRQHYCEIQLDPYEDIPASGDHARVICEGHSYTLIDSGSTWGTWKNDVRVQGSTPLSTGDVITCGQDDRGRQGPQIRFYLAKDILACPCCEGPVYKRHFKCPSCRKKYCLRCIDFRTKTCKLCGQQRGGNYEVVPDDAASQPPARVVFTGADAQRARDAGAPGRPPARPQGAGGPPQRSTKVLPHLNPDGPFSGSDSGSRHGVRSGSGSSQGADSSSGMNEPLPLGDSEPELRRPGEAFAPHQRGPAPPRRTRPSSSGDHPTTGGQYDSDQIPPTERHRDPSVPRGGFVNPFGPSASPTGPFGPMGQRPPAPPPKQPPIFSDDLPFGQREGGGMDPFFTGEKIEARRPPTIPCEQCGAGLSSRDFFVCDRCRGRLCGKHRAGKGICHKCAGAPQIPSSTAGRPGSAHAAPPPPPLARPEQELPLGLGDDSNEASSDRDRLDPDDPLRWVQFECPYCDSPLSRGTKRCPTCRREL